MRVLVKRWGNSASVRIPASVTEAAKLSLDQPVDIRVEAGRVIIEPLEDQEVDLGEMLAGITDENLHEEMDFGPEVGRERL